MPATPVENPGSSPSRRRLHPAITFALVSTGSVMLILLSLLIIGLVLGFMGIRPPVVDRDAITSRLPGGSTVVTAPAEPSSTGTASATSATRNSDAYEAGRAAGKLFRESREGADDFWRGFSMNAGADR